MNLTFTATSSTTAIAMEINIGKVPARHIHQLPVHLGNRQSFGRPSLLPLSD